MLQSSFNIELVKPVMVATVANLIMAAPSFAEVGCVNETALLSC